MSFMDDWSLGDDAGASTLGDSYGYDGGDTGLWSQQGDYNFQPDYTFGEGDTSVGGAPLSSLFSPNSSSDAGAGGGSTISSGGQGPLSYSNTGRTSYGDTPSTLGTDQRNILSKMAGLKAGKDGDVDWTDPKNLMTSLKLLGSGGQLISQMLNKGKQANAMSAAQLQAQLPANKYSAWSPTQQQWADSYFNQKYAPPSERPRQYASDMQSPIVASRGYAFGGPVGGLGSPGDDMGSDPGMMQPEDDGAPQGPLGYVQGAGGGQADDIQANLSGGEYVFDADTVAALGDGNNEAGAKKLDELREAIRKRNRSAPPDQIPPPAEDPTQQLGLGGGEE